MIGRLLSSGAMLLSLSLANAALAQDAVETPEETPEETSVRLVNQMDNEEAITFAYGTPTSPILALTGLEANQVTKIDEFRDFTVTLPDFVNGGEAIAIDFNPSALFSPIGKFEDGVARYRNSSQFTQIMHRSQVSVLAQNGKEDEADPSKSKRTIVGFGLSSSLLAKSDPMYQVYKGEAACATYIEKARGVLEGKAFAGIKGPLGEYLEYIDGDLGLADFFDSFRSRFDILRQKILAEYDVDTTHIPKAGGDVGAPYFVEFDALKAFVNAEQAKRSETSRTRGEQIQSDFMTAYKSCNAAINEALFYAPNLDFGGALQWRGKSAADSDLEAGGQALWLSYRHPLKLKKNPDHEPKSRTHVIFGATGRLGLSEFVATGQDATPEAKADTYQGWVGLEVLSKQWRFGAQLGYVEKNFDAPALEEFSQSGEKYLLMTDYKISENIWIGASYGNARGDAESLRGSRLTVDLKFSTPRVMDLFSTAAVKK